jgi:hypothetical protein
MSRRLSRSKARSKAKAVPLANFRLMALAFAAVTMLAALAAHQALGQAAPSGFGNAAAGALAGPLQ